MKPILIATMKTTLIYGTAASPFAKLPWGRCTRKPGILYLHVFDWPQGGRLVVPGLKSSVRSARLLARGEPPEAAQFARWEKSLLAALYPEGFFMKLDAPVAVWQRWQEPRLALSSQL